MLTFSIVLTTSSDCYKLNEIYKLSISFVESQSKYLTSNNVNNWQYYTLKRQIISSTSIEQVLLDFMVSQVSLDFMVLQVSLDFTEKYIKFSSEEKTIIKHARNSLLLTSNKPESKKKVDYLI